MKYKIEREKEERSTRDQRDTLARLPKLETIKLKALQSKFSFFFSTFGGRIVSVEMKSW